MWNRVGLACVASTRSCVDLPLLHSARLALGGHLATCTCWSAFSTCTAASYSLPAPALHPPTTHVQYADAASYAVKFRQLQARALTAVRTKVQQVLRAAAVAVHTAMKQGGFPVAGTPGRPAPAAQQAQQAADAQAAALGDGAEAALLYVRFRAAAEPALKGLLHGIEQRAKVSHVSLGLTGLQGILSLLLPMGRWAAASYITAALAQAADATHPLNACSLQDYARLLKDCQDLYCETRLALMQARRPAAPAWQLAGGLCCKCTVADKACALFSRGCLPLTFSQSSCRFDGLPTAGARGGAHAAVRSAAAALPAALWLRLPHAGLCA